jgi:methylmalonyl-CoA mutase N-terminal domain/subunit
VRSGLPIDSFAPNLSFFFNAHIDFFEEIAKYRAARRIWARWMRDVYGATDPRSMTLRFHTQTAGVSLTAQQPEVNIARVALEAMAAVLGGTQSLHTDSFDEALALPTEKAARVALRTQQVIAHESGVANVADPLGGSWFVEALTDELENEAETIFTKLRERGQGSILDGVVAAVDEGWFQAQIADAAYDFQRRMDAGDFLLVGVNAHVEGDDTPPPTLYVDPAVEDRQLARLAMIKADRNDEAVRGALARVSADAAEPTVNLVPALLEAVKIYATVGEITHALEAVFGTWTERAVA